MTQAQVSTNTHKGTSVSAEQALTDTEREELAELRAMRAAGKIAPVEAAFTPTCDVIVRPAGYDARGDGMFVTTRPKVEATIRLTRGGKAQVLRKPAAFWVAMLNAHDAITAALDGLDASDADE